MSDAKKYDVVVIGAGSGGLTAAVGFAKAGRKVLLVEREHLGGECTHSGCVPSKALLHIAKSYHAAKQIAGDSARNKKYRDGALDYVRGKIGAIAETETKEHFASLGIDVVMGEAKFVSPCAIQVGPNADMKSARASKTTYEFRKTVIASGSSPRLVKVPGLNEKDILTNQNLFKLEKLPEKLLIIGSGPIGMEMGQAFALLGTRVTIATVDERFAKLEDPKVAAVLEKKFAELGIKVIRDAHIARVDNKLALFEIKRGGKIVGAERSAYDQILVAIGRVPNLPKGLEETRIEYNEQGILIDSQFRTSNKSVFAVGDVASPLKFTHVSGDSARSVVAFVLSRGLIRAKKKAVPKVTYTLPEVAQVGLSYEEAKKKYGEREIIRLEVSYGESDRAVVESKAEGLAIVVAKRLSGKVLGANIIGERAGELIAIFTLAIDEKISLWRLRKIIYAYPTYALLAQKAGDLFLAKQIAGFKADLLYLVKKNLPKLIALIFWGALIYSFQHYKAVNDLSYGAMLYSLYDFFTMSMWGPVIFMGLYAIRPLILFPATLLTALSGAIFGFWWGVIYTILGENASANFAYAIGRYFGSGLHLEDSFLGRFVSWMRARPFESVLFMRLFYVPFDLTNYGSGVLKLPWTSYALATLIGIMPGLTTFVALGAAVDVEVLKMDGLSFMVFDPKYLALSVGIFIVSLFLSRKLRKRKLIN